MQQNVWSFLVSFMFSFFDTWHIIKYAEAPHTSHLKVLNRNVAKYLIKSLVIRQFIGNWYEIFTIKNIFVLVERNECHHPIKAVFQSSHEAPRCECMHEHFHPITMLRS